MLYQREGRLGEADTRFQRALVADPLSHWPYVALAGLKLQTGEYDEAIAFAERCSALLPAEPNCDFFRAIALSEQDHPEQANALLEKVAGSPSVYSVGALVLLGREEEALGLNESELQFGPLTRAWIHAMLGNNDEAFRFFDQALAETPGLIIDAKVSSFRIPSLIADPRYVALLRKIGLEP